MEEKILLKRSSDGLRIQIIGLGILALLLALLGSWLVGKLFGWTSNDGSILKIIIWVVIIGAWLLTSLELWLDWSIKRYEIANEALIVHARAGRWGTAQTIYRYESIISIRMTQGLLGKQFGYGDIHVSIPKIDHDIVMNDIDHPVEQVAEIQKRIGEHGSSTTSLIT